MSLETILDKGKFLTRNEIRKLRDIINEYRHSPQKTKREYSLIIHLAMDTGLTVQEIANLRVGDIFLDECGCYLVVRKGRAGKQRIVYFGDELRQHIIDYLDFKKQIQEPLSKQAPLFYSHRSKTQISKRTVQKSFKKFLNLAGIYYPHSVHDLRHTYALELLRKGANVNFVKKQLGHSSLDTIAIYLSFLENPDQDVNSILNDLYK